MISHLLGLLLLLITPANTSIDVHTPVTKVRSLVLTETTRTGISNRPVRFNNRLWWQAPNRWRTETTSPTAPPLVTVSDGTDVWEYRPEERAVTINRWTPNLDVLSSHLPLGREVGSLEELLQGLRTCYEPKVLAKLPVAGRSALKIDLGVTRCKSASAPEFNGRRVIWVDEESLLLLRSAQWTPAGKLHEVRRVTQIQINVPIAPKNFTFSPPTDVRISDFRPRRPPTSDEYQVELQRLAKLLDFPLLVPLSLPPGYVPLWPRDEPYGVELGYAPASEAWRNSPDIGPGISMLQRKATPSDMSVVLDRGEPIEVHGTPGWFEPGFRLPSGAGGSSRLVLLQDGTWVAITSFEATRAELISLAASLQPVPGSHPALPRPEPRTLAEVRRRVPFPVFIPTTVPPGIKPEPPVGGEGKGDPVTITYHKPDGSVALRIVSGPAGCCLDADPRKRTGPVRLPNGLTGYLLEMEPRYGGPILWWEQDGAFVALSSPVFDKAQLLQIAAGLSSTADLGPTERPIRRPPQAQPGNGAP